MAAEHRYEIDEAERLYTRAWEFRQDDVDASVAAHYLARVQADPQQRLWWNERALQYARQAAPQRAATFLPSLLLNVAVVYRDAGRTDEARMALVEAAMHLRTLPAADPYTTMIGNGIQAALESLETASA